MTVQSSPGANRQCANKRQQKSSLIDMRHRERSTVDRKRRWKKNPCNTTWCFLFVLLFFFMSVSFFFFLIETSFTENKHAISLYKPKPQTSVYTHSDADPVSRTSGRTTRRHTLSDAVQRHVRSDSFALRQTQTHAHSHMYISQWLMGKEDVGRRITLLLWFDWRWEWQHGSSDDKRRR